MSKITTPLVPLVLLEYLESIYKININDIKSLEELKYAQGQQSVLSKLRSEFERQNKSGNIL